MKFNTPFILRSLLSSIGLASLSQQIVFAQITNPATGGLGDNADAAKEGTLFTTYFLLIWRALITVGALAVLIFFLWGAIEWITSAGDSGKLQNSRNRMMHAFIGLVLLVTAYTLVGFISVLFFGEEFNVLAPTFLIAN